MPKVTWRERSEITTRAIQRKGDFAEAFYGRGLARRAKGDGKGAQQDFDQAKRLGYG